MKRLVSCALGLLLSASLVRADVDVTWVMDNESTTMSLVPGQNYMLYGQSTPTGEKSNVFLICVEEEGVENALVRFIVLSVEEGSEEVSQAEALCEIPYNVQTGDVTFETSIRPLVMDFLFVRSLEKTETETEDVN